MPPSPSPHQRLSSRPLRKRMERVASRRRWAEFLRLAVWCLLGVGLLGVLAGERFREEQCAAILLGGMILAALLLLWRLFTGRSRFTMRQLCREFQRDLPQDANALEAALELEEKAAGGEPLSPFQREYLAELQGRYLGRWEELTGKVPSWRPGWRRNHLLLAFWGLLALAWGGRQAWCRFALGLFGTPPIQLTLSPAGEVPLHQDVALRAILQRYEGKDGVWLEVECDGQVRREPMNAAGGKIWELTLYDVTRNGRVRAVTGEGVSPWEKLSVYRAPAPVSVEMVCTPPAYMKLAPRRYDDFQDVKIMEGESLSVECVMPRGESWRLLCKELPGQNYEVPAPEGFQPRDGAVYFAEYLRSPYMARGREFQVQVTPDYPPAVDLRSPEEDGEMTPDYAPEWNVHVSDDFGIRSVDLHYAVDDQEEQHRELWRGEDAPRELDLRKTPDFGKLEPGQVVLAWVEAQDNREPQSRMGRGRAVFLTVREERSDLPMPENQSMGETRHQAMSIADLIAETKRLLRDTLGLSRGEGIMKPGDSARRCLDLSQDLRNLSQAIRGREAQIAHAASVPSLDPAVGGPLSQASQAVGEAAVMVQDGQVEEAMLPQRRALSLLSRLEAMLARNAQSLASGGGGLGEGRTAGEEGEGQEGRAAQEDRGDRRLSLEKLQRALEEVQSLRSTLQEIYPDLQPGDCRRIQEMAERAGALVPQVAAQEGGSQAVEPLRNGTAELTAAGQALQNNALSQAKMRVQRALVSLGAAEEALVRALRQEARLQMDRLTRQAAELARRQEALAEENQGRGSSEGGASVRREARERQSALGRETQAFQRESQEVARELSRRFPQAAGALESMVAQSPLSREVGGAQSRASNALLYGRYDLAAENQHQAAEGLRQWSGRLARAREEIPLYGSQELEQALAELEAMRERVMSSLETEGAEGVQEASRRLLEELGRGFGLPMLEQLAEEAAHGRPEGMVSALDEAGELLRRELSRLQGNTGRELMLNASPPPRKYRQQTQEYFRRLTREP
ncbi:MAG: hypothetical protein ACI4SG_02965 [Oligosphaeraceae bacterium]